MSRLIRISFLTAALAALCSVATADIVIDGYTDDTNDRFTNSPDFIAAQYDLSGLGQNSGRRWATALSRNVIVSAAHFTPSGSVVHFYEGNDATAGSISRTVNPESGMRVPGTDIWLGVLNSNLPDTITSYDIASQILSAAPNPGAEAPFDDAGDYQDVNAFLVGRSPFNTNADASREAYNDQAIGRNQITGYAENVAFRGLADNDTLIMWHDEDGDDDHVDFEAEYRGGDSGGPLFADLGDGQLQVIGVNSFLLEDVDGNLIANGATYLGNQADFINNFIELNAVPEPNSALLITALFSAACVRRRRRI
jgi:hypothetical protein